MTLAMPFDSGRFRARRARVLSAMQAQGGGVAVQLTAPEQIRNAGSEYPYRFDSRFWYLSGFVEPASAIVLVANGRRTESWLFCRERDAAAELWEGERCGPAAAQAAYGFDAAYPIGALDELVSSELVGAASLFYSFSDAERINDPVLARAVVRLLRKWTSVPLSTRCGW